MKRPLVSFWFGGLGGVTELAALPQWYPAGPLPGFCSSSVRGVEREEMNEDGF